MKKQRITFNLDADVVQDLKSEAINASAFVNELLKERFLLKNAEESLLKEKDKLLNKLVVINTKLEEIENRRKDRTAQEELMLEVLEWAFDVETRNGQVGLNMVRRVCRNKGVEEHAIIEELKKRGISLVDFM